MKKTSRGKEQLREVTLGRVVRKASLSRTYELASHAEGPGKDVWAEGTAVQKPKDGKSLEEVRTELERQAKGQIMQDLMGLPTEVIFTKGVT